MVIQITSPNNMATVVQIISTFITAVGVLAAIYISIIRPKIKRLKSEYLLNEDGFFCFLTNTGDVAICIREISFYFWLDPKRKKETFELANISYIKSKRVYKIIKEPTIIDSHSSRFLNFEIYELREMYGHRFCHEQLNENAKVEYKIIDVDYKEFIFKTEYSPKEFFDEILSFQNRQITT